MFIVNFVLSHWIIFSLIYLVLMSWTAVRFANRVAKTQWYSNIYWYKSKRGALYSFQPRRPFLRYPLRFTFLILGYILAVPLFILFQLSDYRDREAEKKREKERVEAAKEVQERRSRTEARNQVRAMQRRDWFKHNRPVLYFNSIGGVTAVLRPVDYERVNRETGNARMNELWDRDILKPDQKTFTFVTKSGSELIQVNSPAARKDKVAGWLSQLHEICGAANCSLVRDETIFVPWINETVLSFSEQFSILQNCPGQTSTDELIDKQAPSEMQELPVY